jgi:hypothetical protein
LTSALDGGEWSASRPGHFTPRGKAPFTHWIGGWVGCTAILDAVVKRKILSPRRESNPRTPIAQPVAQRYREMVCTKINAEDTMRKFIFWIHNTDDNGKEKPQYLLFLKILADEIE